MIFMGPLYRREQEKEIQKNIRVGGSNAGVSFQWNIIDGLRANLDHGIRVINALPVGTWPKGYSKVILPDDAWQLDGVECQEVGCINLPVLKQWTRFLRTRKLIRGLRNEEVLMCTTYMPFLWALSKLDRSNKLTMIVTDIPEFADMHRVSKLRRQLRNINNKLIYRYMKRVDRFVLLTEQMKEPLHVGKRPYIVMEGIYGMPRELMPVTERNRAVLYSGRLNQRYGVGNLLEAFSRLEDTETELWICGTGEMEQAIRDAAARDGRIKFLGFRPQNEVWEMQQRVSVLVNPRQNTEDFTKYSFPSKTMEYMASGTPVLMYKLDGIPDSYDPFLHYVPGSTVADLTDALREVLNGDPEALAQKAQEAQRFILEEKNAVTQAGQILKLMEIGS